MHSTGRLSGPAVAAGLACFLTFLWASPVRASTAYVHVLRGRVEYQRGGKTVWGALPATLMVEAGDRIKLAAGTRASVVYLKGGGKVTVRGPRVYTIQKRGRAPRSKPGAGVGFFKLLHLLVARKASYHKAGVASLSESGAVQGYVNLLSPRYSVIPPGKVELKWAKPRPGTMVYQVTVWRYLSSGREQRITAKTACGGSVCVFAIPTTFALKAGERYYWSVKVAASQDESYPSVGIWFVAATSSLSTKLAADMASAAAAPATRRSFLRAQVLASYGYHQKALDEPALVKPVTANAKKLKAHLLCVTCRPKEANRVSGKPFCKCKEDPDR